MNHLQRQLKKKLEEAQINASELERRASLPLSAARRILLGNTKNPTLETLLAIANALGCTIDELVREEDASHPFIKHESSLLNFEKELFLQLMDSVKGYLHNSANAQNAVSFNDFMTCLWEMYEFFLTHPDRKVDKHFTTWYMDRILNSKMS